MDRESALKKIKKCLALGQSSNANEAATAMRQAHALMQKFQIDDLDMLKSDVAEALTAAGADSRPARWEQHLSQAVARAFACQAVFRPAGHFDGDKFSQRGQWIFIGLTLSAELAQYAFKVLFRQLKRERAVYTENLSGRLKRTTKINRAHLFCEAWVHAVRQQIETFAGDTALPEQVKQYLTLRQEKRKLSTLKPKGPSYDKLSTAEAEAFLKGHAAGKKAELHTPLQADADTFRLTAS